MMNGLLYRLVQRVWCAWFVPCAVGLVLCFVTTTTSSNAQPLAWKNWYFGQRAGLSISQKGVEPLNSGQLSTSEGCASISDPTTGELLFYTDGVTVWNRLHDVMPNGRGLFGDQSTSQSALIVPAPGRPYMYYVFNAAPVTAPNASSRCLCLYYSIVDMRLDAGFGDVTTKNEFLLSDVTEHLTAGADCRGDGWWIITRSRLSRHFYSLHLTRDQLQSLPIVSDVGNPLLTVKDAGQMHVSPDNRKLVMTSTAGHTQLFDFDGETGKVTNAVTVLVSANGTSHYGAAFSLDSRFLYVAASPELATSSSRIFQFDITRPTSEQIASSGFLIGQVSGISSWIAMQLGPDGRIYVGRPGEPRLSVINHPENAAMASDYIDKAIQLPGVMRLGLPNIIGPTLTDPASRSSQCALPNANIQLPRVVCAGSCTSFTDLSTGSIDTWTWAFEGGLPASSQERNPSRICYQAPGEYVVQLITSNLYGADTTQTTIRVEASPNLVVDSVETVCPGSPFTLKVRGAQSYQWVPAQPLSNPHAANPTATISSTTRFTVIGTTTSGCADTATVLVRVPSMAASGDATICAGASTQLRALGASSYEWSPTTGLDDPSSANPKARPPASTVYTVRMTSGSCVVVDTVRVNVLDSFAVDIRRPDLICSSDTVVLSATAGTLYEWSGQGVLDRFAPTTRVVVGSSAVDVFLLAKSGDCVAYDTVHLEPKQSPTIDAGPDVRICQGDAVPLTVTTTAPHVRWITTTGLNSDTVSSVVASPTFTTSYVVEAVTDEGCSSFDTVTVIVTPVPLINAGADLSLCQGASKRILADGKAERISWSPGTGLSDSTIIAPFASPNVTTTYVLRAQSGDCVAYDTVTIYVSRLSLQTSGDVTICKGSAVQLRASGATVYKWSPAVGLSDSSSSSPVAQPDTTTTYQVVGFDALGCVQRSLITVVVQDTVPIRLIAGSITASAGEDSIGIPVFFEVEPSMLPLHVDEFRATLVHDATAFFPATADRGSVRTAIRGTDRLSHIRVEGIDIISPRQKITEIHGLVLAGRTVHTPTTWENVEWYANHCPRITTKPGLLFITGCNLLGRLLESLTKPIIRVNTRPRDGDIDVLVETTVPGEYTIRVIGVDGSTLWNQQFQQFNTNQSHHAFRFDMHNAAQGLYSVCITSPGASQSVPVMWLP